MCECLVDRCEMCLFFKTPLQALLSGWCCACACVRACVRVHALEVEYSWSGTRSLLDFFALVCAGWFIPVEAAHCLRGRRAAAVQGMGVRLCMHMCIYASMHTNLHVYKPRLNTCRTHLYTHTKPHTNTRAHTYTHWKHIYTHTMYKNTFPMQICMHAKLCSSLARDIAVTALSHSRPRAQKLYTTCCMYFIYIYTYTSIYIYVYIYSYIHLYMYKCIFKWTYIHICIHLFIYIHIYI